MDRRSPSLVACLVVSLSLAACGGGGSPTQNTPVVERYPVGGTVTGLTGGGLVLRNNGADDLVVNANGAFHFATPIADGSRYAVTVKTQPAARVCSVASGIGTVSGAGVTSVSVTCAATAFKVGGTVSGLAGPGLVLQDNGGDDLAVDADGVFTFATAVADGGTYAVTVKTQPTGRRCSVGGGTGTIAGANVRSVTVTCATDAYRVGGTVTGLGGPGLVLQNNGGDDLALDADGAFSFATPVANGAGYAVTVKTQPAGKQCTVSGAIGTVAGANVTTVLVTCTTLTFTVGGTVSGLTGSGLVLQDNGGDDLAVGADGAFTFATALAPGDAYAVTVKTQPSGRICSVSGGTGTIAGANVTSVTVTCAAVTFSVGGTVSGVTGSGLVLQDNGGDDLAVDADGAFTFATRLADGAPYAVTVKAQPFGGLCAVSSGAGNVTGANVTSVVVTCAPASFRVGGRVSGLPGPGLVLQDNGGDDLALDADGAFTFATPLPNGATFAVTVQTAPAGVRCSVGNGGGRVSGTDFSGVVVTCASSSFLLTGTVSGLLRGGLVLQDNGGDDLALDADGAFTFATPVADGAAYAVTVKTHPPGARCAVANGSGTVSGVDPGAVTVTCHGWALPAAVEGLAGNASAPVHAFDPNGDAIAVWIQVDGVTSTTHVQSARWSGANATWGAPTRLDSASGDASAPDVAIDSYFGNVIVAWTQKDSGGTAHVWTNRYPTGGPWGTAQQLDTSSFAVTSAPSVAVDLFGNALVAWSQRGSGSFANVWFARYATPFVTEPQGWGAPIRIDTSDAGDAAAPRVALNASGIGFASWQQSDGTRFNVWGARWINSARFSGVNVPVLLETDDTGAAVSPELAVDESGNGFVAWQQPEPGNAALLRVWANRYDATSGWGGPVRLETQASSMRFVDVAADRMTSPNGFAVWRAQGAATVYASRYDQATGIWAPDQVIGGGSSDPAARQLSVRGDASGDAVAIWYDGARVRANRYGAGVGWDGEVLVDTSTAASAPVVQLDASGNGLALWLQPDGTGTVHVMSARFR